jgi:uncharacterized membrane protein YfcA
LLVTLSEFTNLTPDLIWIVIATSLFAGMIRGFTGFALSATVMAVLSNFIAPIEMVAICLCLEIIASFVMVRDGAKNADMPAVWAMVLGSAIGTPIGYFILTNIDRETSRIVALCVISVLAMLLFLRIKARFLECRAGPYLAGTGAGMANMASVGGMVTALYILARDRAVSEMRGTLVIYLMISILGNIIFQLLYGLMTFEALRRAGLMAPFVILGIMTGSYFFRPALQRYYKPVCLLVLIAICVTGLVRQLVF